MEMWDLYNNNREPLYKTHERGKPLNSGEYHIVVTILSVNKQGQILITKRHPDKPYGNKWEFTGGSALAGEDSLSGATRELAEETGLKADKSDLDFRGHILRPKHGGLRDYYLYNGDFSANDITLQEGETVDFKLVSPAELYLMTQSGEFLDFEYNRAAAMFEEFVVPNAREGVVPQKPRLVRNIHHVSLKAVSAQKLDEAVKFYCNILGMRLHRQWENGVLIDCNGMLIEIFLTDKKLESGVIKHFALGTDDVSKCVETVREHGYAVVVEPNKKELPSVPPVKLEMAFVIGALGEEIEFFHNL